MARFTYPFFAFLKSKGVIVMIDETTTTPMTTSDVFVPDVRTMTTIETGKGQFQVIHEITLGDILLSTVLMAILIFTVLDRLIRR